MKKKIKIGFDLDGVIVGRPPLVPKRLIELLFKGCNKGLHYRFPKSRFEQRVRKLSHFYLFRPPLKKNIAFVKKIARNSRCEIYLVSSRYSFLQTETDRWLRKRQINNIFKEIRLNLKDKQPHLFKEEVIKKLDLDYFFEDDASIVAYLKRVMKTEIFLVNGDSGENFQDLVCL